VPDDQRGAPPDGLNVTKCPCLFILDTKINMDDKKFAGRHTDVIIEGDKVPMSVGFTKTADDKKDKSWTK